MMMHLTMDVLLRKYYLQLLFHFFLLCYFHLWSLLLSFFSESYVYGKVLCGTLRFNIKSGRNIDKANSKIFQVNFASFPLVVIGHCFFDPRFYMNGSLVYNLKN